MSFGSAHGDLGAREGCRVTLADGRELLDLTGGFGVAALGHRNPRIFETWREQEVVHALGDLADAAVTVRCERRCHDRRSSG